MKFITRIINLWRIQKNPTTYELGVLRHLDTDPRKRKAVKTWHDGKVARIIE